MEKLPCSIGNIYIFKDFKGSILDCYVSLPECTFSMGKASVFQLPFFRGELLNFSGCISLSVSDWIFDAWEKKVPSKILPNIPSLKLTWLRPWKSGRVVYLVVENSTHLKNYASQKNYIISPGKCSCPVIFWMSFIPWDPIICKTNHQPGNAASLWPFFLGMVKTFTTWSEVERRGLVTSNEIKSTKGHEFFITWKKTTRPQGFYEINRGQNIYPDF